MADISKFALDESKVQEGIWVEWEGDISLLLAPMHNERMEQFIRKRTATRTRGYRRRELSDEETERITLEAVATHVLVGWKNLQSGGQDIEYSAEKSLELLSMPGLRHLYRFVILTASDEALFRAEIEEAELGN